jgi:sulfur relay (sulfurtransferase) complex TusBCD TusD component (DsrE family)
MAGIAHSKGHRVNLFFIDGGVMWANKERDLTVKTVTGDCPNDHLPYLVENEVTIGVCTPCARSRHLDEAKFFHNMALDGGPHLIEMAAESKVFNF